MNAIEILKDDHDKMLTIFNQMNRLTPGDTEQMKELFGDFKSIFLTHDDNEQDIVYPQLREHRELKELIDKSYQAHHFTKVALQEIRLLPYTADNWLPKFQALSDNIKCHMQEEEAIIFPKAEQICSSAQLNNMTDEMEKTRR